MHFLSFVVISLTVPLSEPFGFGGSTGPLYSENDVGITLLDSHNFKKTVLHSQTAWMVEFYSSWCGHCIRFAPTFKELTTFTEGWKSIMKVGAIDCAQDQNVPICRDYEIMGYPSLKFFPPNASDSEQGRLRDSYSQNINLIMDDMAKYMETVASNSSFFDLWKKSKWPNFEIISDQDTNNLWKNENSDLAILIVEPDDSSLGYFSLMELNTLIQQPENDHIIFRRGQSSEMTELLSEVQATQPLAVIAMTKGQDEASLLYESIDTKTTKTWRDVRSVLRNYVRNHKSTGEYKLEVDKQDSFASKSKSNSNVEKDMPEIREEELKRRRYTAYMSDLENAVIYSLTHEVGSHSSIVGPALTALQDYTEVLSRHFPGRDSTKKFLHELFQWVIGHSDAVRGEDLIAKIVDMRAEFGTFADLPYNRWVGCKGSKPIYGGYPCSLWTLWHVLTVNQDGEENPPSKVLDTMTKYVKHFFGCEDCSRHFLQGSEDGKVIQREVVNKTSSILWLWRFHNRVNMRLSGDVTDDKVFPKEVFPNRQHCSDCYNNRLGNDLWSEFNLEKIQGFLQDVYGSEHLNYYGLTERLVSHKEVKTHDLELLHDKTQHDKYTKDQGFSFWGPIDFSLCFSIYLLSAVILMIVYFKFVAKRKPCFGFSNLFQRNVGQNSLV